MFHPINGARTPKLARHRAERRRRLTACKKSPRTPVHPYEMTELIAQPHIADAPLSTAGDSRDSSAPIVRLGRRVASAPWPRGLERVRSAIKKLVWTAHEARLVTNPLRYVFHELVRPNVSEYRLRRGRGKIVLRHRSGDIDIFRKFYGYGYYEWPEAVIARLESLGRPLRILDLGANIGFFEVYAQARWPIAEMTGFEPDPGNASILERVRDANGACTRIVQACASNANGTATFKTGHKNFSRIEPGGDRIVETIDVFPHVGQADLVKMNIEGSEWEIMEDPRLADTDAVWIVEYHRIRNPGRDIEALARQLFERQGYQTAIAMSHDNNGLLWAFKPEKEAGGPAAR
jgi:FkbM family methyltransferase